MSLNRLRQTSVFTLYEASVVRRFFRVSATERAYERAYGDDYITNAHTTHTSFATIVEAERLNAT